MRLPNTGWAGCIETGKGVPQDDAEAVKWYRKAAVQGNTDAQKNLGSMYENGKGVPLNYAEAVTWYVVAAGQGNLGAQYNLGVMYENGKGVPQSATEALMWYIKAAVQGNTDAQKKLDQMKGEGIKVGKAETKPLITKELPDQKTPSQGQTMAQWWYADKGIQKGPVETEELKKLLQIGKINLKTMVWQEGMAAWQPLGEVEQMTSLRNSSESEIVAREHEEKIFEQVANELKSGTRREGLWAKAYTESDGDELKTRALYIRYRAQSLIDEKNKEYIRAESERKAEAEEVRRLEELKQDALKAAAEKIRRLEELKEDVRKRKPNTRTYGMLRSTEILKQ